MTLALFLYHIRYFLEYVLRRMYLKLEQERSKELYYRKLWHCQRKSIEDVASKIYNFLSVQYSRNFSVPLFYSSELSNIYLNFLLEN